MKLRDIVEQEDCPNYWGAEIRDDPRFQFVERLQRHTPLEAVALHLAINDWWSARRATDYAADYRDIPHLALHRFFNVVPAPLLGPFPEVSIEGIFRHRRSPDGL